MCYKLNESEQKGDPAPLSPDHNMTLSLVWLCGASRCGAWHGAGWFTISEIVSRHALTTPIASMFDGSRKANIDRAGVGAVFAAAAEMEM